MFTESDLVETEYSTSASALPMWHVTQANLLHGLLGSVGGRDRLANALAALANIASRSKFGPSIRSLSVTAHAHAGHNKVRPLPPSQLEFRVRGGGYIRAHPLVPVVKDPTKEGNKRPASRSSLRTGFPRKQRCPPS
jgi:hypothetical protein